MNLEEIQQNYNISKPMVAGILLILAGIIGIISWAYMVGEGSILNYIVETSEVGMDADQIRNAFMTCGAIGIILSVFSILGGILSIKRKKWKVIIVSSLFGLFIMGFFLLSSILCLLATILLIMSKNEFL